MIILLALLLVLLFFAVGFTMHALWVVAPFCLYCGSSASPWDAGRAQGTTTFTGGELNTRAAGGYRLTRRLPSD